MHPAKTHRDFDSTTSTGLHVHTRCNQNAIPLCNPLKAYVSMGFRACTFIPKIPIHLWYGQPQVCIGFATVFALVCMWFTYGVCSKRCLSGVSGHVWSVQIQVVTHGLVKGISSVGLVGRVFIVGLFKVIQNSESCVHCGFPVVVIAWSHMGHVLGLGKALSGVGFWSRVFIVGSGGVHSNPANLSQTRGFMSFLIAICCKKNGF